MIQLQEFIQTYDKSDIVILLKGVRMVKKALKAELMTYLGGKA